MLLALLVPFALLQASAPPLPATPSATPPPRFERCVAAIETNAETAYEEAMAWAADGEDVLAYRCAAMALSAQGRHAEAARRFESLAATSSLAEPGLRAVLYSQAGNSYLLSHEASRGRAALTQSYMLMRGEPNALPDILIDRGRAYAMEADWRHAEEDLSAALDLRADNPLALRLRADARMHQTAYALALADAERAVTLEPTNIEARLVLGRVREAQRTGQIPLD